MKKTRQLVASLIAIVICFAMLLGTTYAWFTDSIVNTNNIIKSGNVDVELWHKSNANEDFEEVKEDTKLFVNTANEPILWEPGASATETFEVRNVGSLALKYNFSVKAVSKTLNENNESLEEVLKLTVNQKEYDFGYIFDGKIAAKDAPVTYTVTINWDSTANDNDFMNLKLLLGVELVATQDYVEIDGSGNPFDGDAELPTISNQVTIPEEGVTGNTTFSGVGENPVSVTVPADLINNLPEEVKSMSLVYTEPKTEGYKVTFDSIEFVDQDGNIIDLSANEHKIEATIPLPSDFNAVDGTPVDVLHDGVKVATGYVEEGAITYEALHFCEVSVKKYDFTEVKTADELVEALETGKSVLLTADIKIDPASMSNAYGTTGINITKGQAIFGGNHTIDIKGAGGTWDSGINTTGGIIRDLTVTGSFRGIFINHNSTHSEPVVLDNVIIDGTTYTISCDQGMNQTLIATNCTFNGWTSYAAKVGTAKFVDCYFGEGNGYAYCRPYAPTEFVGCTFEAGYEMDPRAAVTFENCKLADAEITAENLATLVTSNIANASVK